MNIDAAVLARLETLAALDDPTASAAECAARCAALAQIVAHIQTLEAVHVDDVELSTLDAPQALRADQPRPGLTREAALRGAAHADETTFMVPRIVP